MPVAYKNTCLYKCIASFLIVFNKKRIVLCLLFSNLLLSLYTHGHFSMSVHITLPRLFWELCYILLYGCAMFYLTILLMMDIYNPAFLWASVWSGTLFCPRVARRVTHYLILFKGDCRITIGSTCFSAFILRREGGQPVPVLWRITFYVMFKDTFVSDI